MNDSFFYLMFVSFPIYRKLQGFNRFYKIESSSQFIELSFIQNQAIYQTIQANQYPEKLRIQDMIACEFQFAEMSTEEIEMYFQ